MDETLFVRALREKLDPNRLQRTVDVESELFPYLRERVPTWAIALKGAPQEPVLAGISRDTLTLPVADVVSEPPRTVLELIWRRRRRILIASLCALAGAIAAVEGLFFHVSPTDNNRLSIAVGIRQLSFLLPLKVGIRAELPYQTTDAATLEVAGALQRGEYTGRWHPKDPELHLRQWYKLLGNLLAPDQQDEWYARLGKAPTIDLEFLANLNAHPTPSSILEAGLLGLWTQGNLSLLDEDFTIRSAWPFGARDRNKGFWPCSIESNSPIRTRIGDPITDVASGRFQTSDDGIERWWPGECLRNFRHLACCSQRKLI